MESWDYCSFLRVNRGATVVLILALLNFSQTFIVEIDALGFGMWVVLYYDAYLIAYFSKKETIYLCKNQLLCYY